MGVWEFINSTTETVKQNAPDLTPVKDACRTSYGYGSTVVSKIDNAVRVNGLQRLHEYMSDEKGRARITLFASKLAQNAAEYAFEEGFKLVPGGKAVSEIVSKTVCDVKSENHSKPEMEAMKEVIGASWRKSTSRNVLDRVEMQNKGAQKGISADSTANQRPEDVLRIFMTKESIGARFLDDLIIAQQRHGKEPK